MKVEIISRKLIKPSIPTPTSLQNYHISFTDELAPTMNVPLILYYPWPAAATDDHQAKNGTISLHNNLLLLSKFENTLGHTLTKFYPLAGRYMNRNRSIDCSDQGVQYVQAKVVGVQLKEILAQGVKPEVLNDFIPCEVGAADELSDPLLSIQVTMFDCGGIALGFCFSHRLVDMATISTFIESWAAASKGSEDSNVLEFSPIFNSAILFPAKDSVPRLDFRLPRTSTGVLENEARKFLFNNKAISALRGKAAGVKDDPSTMQTRPYSKVQLVFALLYKAMLGVERAKNGRSKPSTLFLPTNLRDKVVPPLPKESFGNFWGLATARLKAGEADSIEFKSSVDLIRDSIRKTASECKGILSRGDEGYGVIINPFLDMNVTMASYNDVNCYMFTSWSKFSFYQADFGWGKPMWASTVKLPIQNAAILMDDKAGDGIEAWVHLHKNDMIHFQQDPDILAFADF